MPHTVRIDEGGSFFEDHTRGSCDFCDLIADVEDGYLIDDGRFMCHECHEVLHAAESERQDDWMRENKVMFAVFPLDVDSMLRENPDALDGRKAIRESIELQMQDVREQELLRQLREEG